MNKQKIERVAQEKTFGNVHITELFITESYLIDTYPEQSVAKCWFIW